MKKKKRTRKLGVFLSFRAQRESTIACGSRPESCQETGLNLSSTTHQLCETLASWRIQWQSRALSQFPAHVTCLISGEVTVVAACEKLWALILQFKLKRRLYEGRDGVTFGGCRNKMGVKSWVSSLRPWILQSPWILLVLYSSGP